MEDDQFDGPLREYPTRAIGEMHPKFPSRESDSANAKISGDHVAFGTAAISEPIDRLISQLSAQGGN